MTIQDKSGTILPYFTVLGDTLREPLAYISPQFFVLEDGFRR